MRTIQIIHTVHIVYCGILGMVVHPLKATQVIPMQPLTPIMLSLFQLLILPVKTPSQNWYTSCQCLLQNFQLMIQPNACPATNLTLRIWAVSPPVHSVQAGISMTGIQAQQQTHPTLMQSLIHLWFN